MNLGSKSKGCYLILKKENKKKIYSFLELKSELDPTNNCGFFKKIAFLISSKKDFAQLKKKEKELCLIFCRNLKTKSNLYPNSGNNFFSLFFWNSLTTFEGLKLCILFLFLNKITYNFHHLDKSFFTPLFFDFSSQLKNPISINWCINYGKIVHFFSSSVRTLPYLKKIDRKKYRYFERMKKLLNYKRELIIIFEKKKKKNLLNNTYFDLFPTKYLKIFKLWGGKKFRFVKGTLNKISLNNFNLSAMKIFENDQRVDLNKLLIQDLFEKAKYDSTRHGIYSKISFLILGHYKETLDSKKKANVLLTTKQKEEILKSRKKESFFWVESQLNFSDLKLSSSINKNFFLLQKRLENFSETEFFYFLIQKKGIEKKILKFFMQFLFFFLKSKKNLFKGWIIEIFAKYLIFFEKKQFEVIFNSIFWNQLQKKFLLNLDNFRNNRVFFLLVDIVCQIKKIMYSI